MMGKKVLFINNNRSLLLISGLLSKMGYEVNLVDSVAIGLSKLDKEVYDLIIIQENPNTESWRICEQIRWVSSTPLVVISLNASPDTCAKAINAGADFFLRKPFGPLEFLARINSLLQYNTPRQPFSLISQY